MFDRIANPKFFIPAIVIAFVAIWVTNNVMFVGNLVRGRNA